MRWLAIVALAACGGHSAASGDGAVDTPFGDGAAPSCPHGQWCVETAPIPTTTLLHTVLALPDGAVIAVGDHGTIILRRDGAWTQIESGTTETLRGVWGASSSDVWVFGTNATVLHFDGVTVSPVTVPQLAGADLFAAWGSSATDVWVAGTQVVGHYTGTWTKTAVVGDHNGITGTSPTDVWVVGENEKPQHFDGTWHVVDAGVGTLFFAVYAVSANEVWASDPTSNEQTVEWTGAAWTPHSTTTAQFPSGAQFQALWGASADLWGVGATKTGHWDGQAWTLEQPMGSAASLFGITGLGGDIWAVGDNALILHRD